LTFKRRFLGLFPGKDQEGLTFNASVEMSPGMAAIEAAKTAVKAMLRKATAGWLAATSPPCIEIQLDVPKGDVDNVAKVLQQALDALQDIIGMVMPNANWTSQADKSSSPPSVVLTGDLTESFKSFINDPEFMKMAKQVLDNIAQLDLGLTFGADFADVLANPSTPVVSLLRGVKLSAKSQITKDGKQLAEQVCPSLDSLLRLLVGADIAFLFGYHEKHMEEACTSTNGNSGVKWFTLEDLQQYFSRMAEKNNMPDDVATALKAFKGVMNSITGIAAVNIKNLPFGSTGNDIMIALNKCNPFPTLAYVLNPLMTLQTITEGDEAAETGAGTTEAAEGEDGGEEEGGEEGGDATAETNADASPGSPSAKKKPKAKGKAKTKAKAKTKSVDKTGSTSSIATEKSIATENGETKSKAKPASPGAKKVAKKAEGDKKSEDKKPEDKPPEESAPAA
jgi:hypothetical protein